MDEEVRSTVAELRLQINRERESIATLNAELEEAPAREFLSHATNHADDAEAILRGIERSSQPWVLIRGAKLFLGLATEHRKRVEAARQAYGPDVTVAG